MSKKVCFAKIVQKLIWDRFKSINFLFFEEISMGFLRLSPTTRFRIICITTFISDHDNAIEGERVTFGRVNFISVTWQCLKLCDNDKLLRVGGS